MTAAEQQHPGIPRGIARAATPSRHGRSLLATVSTAAALLALGCTTQTGDDPPPGQDSPDAAVGNADADPQPAGQPPGPDTDEPFPIDTGDDGEQTPGTYKGLVQRLTDNGEPTVTAVDGVIGVVCIGMSNSTQECSDYISKMSTAFAGQINTAVTVVDCARGGNAIESWNDPANDERLWDRCIDTLLPQNGLSLDQVRVVYHKAANQFTTGTGGAQLPFYPDPGSDYENFYDNLTDFAARANTEFPALQALYTTSRSYGGFSGSPIARGEPLSYEEGHALNSWLADNPTVGGVWQGWGPYIWAPDCATGDENGSGYCYVRDDFQDDGHHPAQGARDKISEMIHASLSEHAWYQP